MLLDHVGCGNAARRIEKAVNRALSDGIRTRDLDGEANTEQMTRAIIERLE
jgi:isocitrate/isopropylmalate dehydrogenase